MEFMTPQRLSLILIFVQMAIRELADTDKLPASEDVIVQLARQYGQAYGLTIGEARHVLRTPLLTLFQSPGN